MIALRLFYENKYDKIIFKFYTNEFQNKKFDLKKEFLEMNKNHPYCSFLQEYNTFINEESMNDLKKTCDVLVYISESVLKALIEELHKHKNNENNENTQVLLSRLEGEYNYLNSVPKKYKQFNDN